MENETTGFSGDPGGNSFRPILHQIRGAISRYGMLSLDRQAAVCENLLTQGPIIDVAILGQFKAGKSSFINTLIGRPVLPVGVIPVTTVITRLQYGSQEKATVVFFDGSKVDVGLGEIEDYISEGKNPGNAKSVEVVDIELPSLEVYEGLRLVDTPGLGSVFKYNTEMSREWLPEVGCAIIAISSDRPLSESDLNLIEELTGFTPKVTLLLTKVDLLTEEQQKEVVRFFRDTLKREFAKDFDILLYSTRKETELYRRWLDNLLIGLSVNRAGEYNGIVRHKIGSLARQCATYLDLALKTSVKADTDRDALKKLIFDEKVNYDIIRTELFLVARECKLQTRTGITTHLEETQRQALVDRLFAKLSRDMPAWKGNLWKLTRRYEDWLMATMTEEMDHISRIQYKNFFGSLKRAHNSISRSVELFRNLLDRNIEKALGTKIAGVDWVIEVSEPAHPDIAFIRTFDFHFDLLWFFIPMFVFRGIFENHFRRQIPAVVDIHLSRLAYQWEVRINKTIDEIAEQALKYVEDELATIEALLLGTEGRTDDIRVVLQGLRDNFSALNSKDQGSDGGAVREGELFNGIP